MTRAAFQSLLPALFCRTNRNSGVNTYLLDTPTGRVLIDPAADVTPAMTGPITRIVVTHLQAENAAGCLNFPAVPLHVPAGDEYLCAGPAAVENQITPWPPPWDWRTRGKYQGHLAGAPNERPLPRPVKLAESLHPDTTLAGFTVVATPGHGKQAVTLLTSVAGQQLAFCGDLIYDHAQLWNWFDLEWDYGAQTGVHALLESAQRLSDRPHTHLLPAHGPPATGLNRLAARLQAVLSPPDGAPWDETPHQVPARPARVAGFRELLPNLLQWTDNAGNCAVLLSSSGHALLVDDGLCQWLPLPERAARHRQVMDDLKRAYQIRRIEVIIPTHYHGDHVENIPALVAADQSTVIALDVVAAVLEQPAHYPLACRLPWYGTKQAQIMVDQPVPDGTVVPWREYELEIFHLAGQTYYHAGIAVTLARRRVIFVGDAFNLSPNPEPVLCYNDNEPIQRGWVFALERLGERRPDLLVAVTASRCGIRCPWWPANGARGNSAWSNSVN
ncbi:MAG: Hydroxyacylglutathione hydrolase [Verrucomicrobiae bacterium]|nr:Hydroxyacylglutathione hydrolase [Verrucomicrobiae bacterium]